MPSTTPQRLRDMGKAISTTFPSFVAELEIAAKEFETLTADRDRLAVEHTATSVNAHQHP